MVRSNKYRNKKTETNLGKFDSKAEAIFAQHLLELAKANMILTFEKQPKIYLTKAKILYKPDFLVHHNDGALQFFDVKGMQTPVFKLKKRLWRAYMNSKLTLVKVVRGKVIEIESIIGEA
jgi:hypothetical protein